MIPISKPYIGEEEKQAVLDVLESGFLVQGPRTAEFEQRFADLCGARQAIATANGTTALHLALLAHGIGPGDEVITTPFTFIASVNSILFTGARPVFADVQLDTFNVDPEQVERAITPRTRAVMPVHLYGYMCDMDALQTIADQHGLVIIEDACQAVGATYQGRPAGSFGAGVFSLYATKNLMTAEGGMITTNDDEIAERCRLLRNHGMKKRYHHEMLGFNFRMTDIQAALGLAQLNRLAWITNSRQSNAAYLNNHIHSVLTPQVKLGYGHVWHQYTIRVDGGRDREAAVRHLNDAGVGTGIFYPIPAHHQPHVRAVVGDVSMPVSERLAREVISLPVHPLLTLEDLDKIVEAVNQL
ncbi:MAG: DegT/DnrJ/EryC1/StrS aminotransferase family protein [Chloroflexota bacterium]